MCQKHMHVPYISLTTGKPGYVDRFWLCDQWGNKNLLTNLCLDFPEAEILHTHLGGSCFRDKACPV